MNQPTWRDRFDEKFVDKFYNIVNSELAYEELKYGEDTDVQELRDFIQSELSQQRKEIVEWSKQLIGKHNARILNEFQKQGTTEMPFIAYDERVCLIPAITIAMEETDDDIITKLSEEK